MFSGFRLDQSFGFEKCLVGAEVGNPEEVVNVESNVVPCIHPPS